MPALLLLLVILLAAQPAVASLPRRVAIVDRFFPPAEFFASERDREVQLWMYGLLDVDSDRRREPYFHGDLVRLIASHPDIAFMLYPIPAGIHPLDAILLNLREIRARLAHQSVDAVLLAWESSTLISAFDEPFRPDARERYKSRLRQWAEEGGDWRRTLAIIDELETLSRQGVLVVTIAGNGGRGMVNTFSFAQGVVTVGALEPELGDFVSDNALVDRHEQAAYFARRIDDPDGIPQGYDINGDGCADIPLSVVSGKEYPKRSWPPLKGSSFAAPMALKRILLGDAAAGHCLAQAEQP
ncbi:hypothetical protein GCM10011348_04940 [Marinobacterium nitratireducens]|uniref:Peptidase S8/S53 domain-containing protein n=1 Tax=Marinobacterium nitratireducens TaxID=518897 RepID=A0A917Z6V7_9GAMM|nr:hypothetical protein [Marinobacterium nitratireducens]GGO76820.1 hypothetical protein GCM10011348_04940 [Marinobacterium nitratireducens]